MKRKNSSDGQIFCVVFSMIKDKSIIIKNIYYMLAYAFQALGQPQYDEIASEEFENIHDLFAAILAKGALKQLKQGLYRVSISEHIGYGGEPGELKHLSTRRKRKKDRFLK
jgi:5-methylcytosine-specific restriction enzyme subunit McrC